ncbi:MAG: PEGA domain-containing protein [Eubacteriales bacterium]|nr:PEGA domain-containing protein [Eubacteriales bacterium]
MNIKHFMKKEAALLLIIVLSVSLSAGISGCGKKSAGTIIPGSSITPAPSKPVTELSVNNANEIAFTGVLTYLNTSDLKMHFVDISSGTEYEVSYTGGTDIQNSYRKIKAASTMELGEIYDVTCNKSGKAVKIYGSESAWERKGITGLAFDESRKKIIFGSTEYSYDSHAVVMSAAEKISIAQIVAQDEVTVRGVDNKVYSVNVDNGHGYIQLTGIDSFKDGYLTVGRSQLLEVGKNMLVTAPVGTYSVTLQKGSLVGRKTVTVKKDEQTSLDFSECTTEAVKMGVVSFMVTPVNAVMSIDGKKVDYSQPVSLAYGNHRIVLQANYYDTYSAMLTVGSDFSNIVIDMTEVSSTTNATTKASSQTTAAKATTGAKEPSTSTDLTAGYSVNVTTPEGAVLYVDGVSMGTIPCKFDKSSGSKTVTLSKEGYKTVSYTITINNATGDLKYSFPDMVEE